MHGIILVSDSYASVVHSSPAEFVYLLDTSNREPRFMDVADSHQHSELCTQVFSQVNVRQTPNFEL